MLPEEFRAYAGIGDTAIFVGQGFKFQIWEPQRFAERQRETRAHLRSVTRGLGQSGQGNPTCANRESEPTLADRSAQCRSSCRRCWSTSNVTQGGRYIDGTFGAGGYSARHP